MNRINVGWCVLPLVAACAPGGDLPTDGERRAIAASVDSATRAFAAAQRARDPERAVAHLAPEFYMYNGGRRAGYDSVADGIRRVLGTHRHVEPNFENIEVRVLGRHAAVASFTFRDSIVTAAGETLRFRGSTTLVWERRGDDWLITYGDADEYALPLDEGAGADRRTTR